MRICFAIVHAANDLDRRPQCRLNPPGNKPDSHNLPRCHRDPSPRFVLWRRLPLRLAGPCARRGGRERCNDMADCPQNRNSLAVFAGLDRIDPFWNLGNNHCRSSFPRDCRSLRRRIPRGNLCSPKFRGGHGPSYDLGHRGCLNIGGPIELRAEYRSCSDDTHVRLIHIEGLSCHRR
jgi:hypothetical protein